MSQQPRTIDVNDVLAMVLSGKARKDIRAELGLTIKQMADLFQHPKLKNRRTVAAPVVFVDRMEEETPEESFEHTVTEADLKHNSELVEEGVQVGETITVGEALSPEEAQNIQEQQGLF